MKIHKSENTLLAPLPAASPRETEAKPHLKCGAWAVSLGSEMWGSNLVVFLPGTRPLLMSPLGQRWVLNERKEKVNKPGDKLQISGHQVWPRWRFCPRIQTCSQENQRLSAFVKSCWGWRFCFGDSYSVQVLFSKAAPLRQALLGRRWMLGSQGVCLGSFLYA